MKCCPLWVCQFPSEGWSFNKTFGPEGWSSNCPQHHSVGFGSLNLFQVKSSKFLSERGTTFICLKHAAQKQGAFFDLCLPVFPSLVNGSSSLGCNNLEINVFNYFPFCSERGRNKGTKQAWKLSTAQAITTSSTNMDQPIPTFQTLNSWEWIWIWPQGWAVNTKLGRKTL